MVTKKIDLAKPGQQIIEVGPALAKSWLLLNKHNRKIKQHKITQYARDMREGNWRYTGEALKFNNRGELADGQNRLHAIIDAQVSVPMLIVTGVDPEAQQVMDAGAPRTAADALHLDGFKNGQPLAATIRVHLMWKAGSFAHCMSSVSGDIMPSNAETVKYAEEHPDMVAAAVGGKQLARRLRLPVGATGASYYEFLRIDPDDAQEFYTRITELELGGKGDPIATLVKRTQEMANRREHVRAPLGVYMMVRTWNAARSNEHFEKFQFGSQYRGWNAIPDPK